MENKCQDCKWWTPNYTYDFGGKRDENFGICASDNLIAQIYAGFDIRPASLKMHKDQGCVFFQARDLTSGSVEG